MRKPSLSFDTFVAALAVLGVSGSAGCSRADRGAKVAPEPAATASPPASAESTAQSGAQATPSPAAAPPAPAAAPPAPAPTAGQVTVPDETKPTVAKPKSVAGPTPVRATAVDGGAADKVEKKKANMSCGAGGCTADMKKGTGN